MSPDTSGTTGRPSGQKPKATWVGGLCLLPAAHWTSQAVALGSSPHMALTTRLGWWPLSSHAGLELEKRS